VGAVGCSWSAGTGEPLAWHWVLLGWWALLRQVEQVRECTRCTELWLLADALEAVGWIRWTCCWLMLLWLRWPRLPGGGAYESLRDKRLDRVTRHFGWRLLHSALRCGAAAVHWCAADTRPGLLTEVCCRDSACAAAAVSPDGLPMPALADFTHTFLRCPAARPAVEWLYAMWHRIAPGDPAVPLDVRLLLLCCGCCCAVGCAGDAAVLRVLLCRWMCGGCECLAAVRWSWPRGPVAAPALAAVSCDLGDGL
jgi:hypothetical protein